MYSLLNAVFALCFGWGGKMAINVFILISGYFMCRQEFRWRKVALLAGQVEFYRITIYLVFVLSGYEAFSLKAFYKAVMTVPLGMFGGFTGSFIAMYCLIPFINRLISALDVKDFQKLLAVSAVVFCAVPTFVLNARFEYLVWYIFMYLVGAYIRLYPIEFLDGKMRTGLLAVASVVVSWLSVALIYIVQTKVGRSLPYYWFVNDSNKILAFVPAVLIFFAFRNMDIGSNRVINLVGASTFGVLLIHASSDTMRKWLWQDVCKNEEWFVTDRFIPHAALTVLVVFLACSVIDIVRRQFCRIILKDFFKGNK